jgi:hypothetical protein
MSTVLKHDPEHGVSIVGKSVYYSVAWHTCLQARISIVHVLVRSEYYRLLDGAVR